MIQEQPNPILNTYRKWDWNTDKEDQRKRKLNANYITYKTAQPYDITFVNEVRGQRHLFAGNFMATTSDVNDFFYYNFYNYPFSLSWANQTYTSIKTSLINGTMSILGSVINWTATTLNINAPITPLYAPANLSLNPPQFAPGYTVNPEGSIGFIRGFKTGTTFTAGTGVGGIAVITLPSGVYFETLETSTNWAVGVPTSFFSIGIKVGPINNTFAGAFASKQAIRLIAGQDTPVIVYGIVVLTATSQVFGICETDPNGFARKDTYIQALRIA
jgi:hypothetical protein